MINVNLFILVQIASKLCVPLHEIYHPEADGEFPNPVKLDLVDVCISRKELESAQELLNALAERDELLEVEKHKWYYLQAKVWNESKEHDKVIAFLEPRIKKLESGKQADDTMMCQLYTQLGNAYYYKNKYVKSLSVYENGYAYVLRMQVFDVPSANLAYNLGMVCNELELREDAEKYLEEARDFFQSVSDPVALAHTYFQFRNFNKGRFVLVQSEASIQVV